MGLRVELALIAEPFAVGDARERRGEAAYVKRAFALEHGLGQYTPRSQGPVEVEKI